MAYAQTKTLINALEHWKDTVKPERQDYDTLVRLLLFRLGHRGRDAEEPLKALESRIVYLAEHERMDEDLLVMAAAHAVTDYLQRVVIRHGQRILDFEGLAQVLEAKGETSELVERSLAKEKEPGRLPRLLDALDVWRSLVAGYLGEARREAWREERLAQASNKIQKAWGKEPSEIRGVVEDIPTESYLALLRQRG